MRALLRSSAFIRGSPSPGKLLSVKSAIMGAEDGAEKGVEEGILLHPDVLRSKNMAN